MTRREISMLPFAAMAAAPNRKMTIQLDCGSIGVKAGQPEALEHAKRHGFESVSADGGWLGSQPASAVNEFLAAMKQSGIVWGNAGMPVNFRTTDDEFRKGMADLPSRAAALQRAGVTRITTWISPTSDQLTFLENLKLHGARLREVARVLENHGLRFGLEYVGPKTSWSSRRYPFVHTMKEMKELIAEIGRPNMGMVLDSWHWYTANETLADLKTLTNRDIVSIDLNDAPAGRKLDEQKDSERELPCATGVIDIAGFMNTLNELGCDAPARCEPFNAPLRKMSPEEALAATAAAMKKAFGTIR
jgi:sugar phosphate isomerase/epimerase